MERYNFVELEPVLRALRDGVAKGWTWSDCMVFGRETGPTRYVHERMERSATGFMLNAADSNGRAVASVVFEPNEPVKLEEVVPKLEEAGARFNDTR